MINRWILGGVLACLLPAVAVACGNDTTARPGTSDAGPAPTTPPTNPTGTSTTPFPDGGPPKRAGCLDRPNAAPPRPDRLPCELIPPGLTL